MKMKKLIKNILASFIKNCMQECMQTLTNSSQTQQMRQQPIYLGNNLMLCQMKWGGWVVAPTYNIDVAVGAIRDGCIEIATTQFIKDNLSYGDYYINVGANFGYYTSLAGNIVGNKGFVYSYEANPVMFAILLRTIFYAGIPDRIKAFNRAVSNCADKTVELFFDYQFIGGGTVVLNNTPSLYDNNLIWDMENVKELLHDDGSFIGKGLYSKADVKTTTLDLTVTHQYINMIQCDAEGSEPFILLGARDIISRSKKIKIIFEWHATSYQRRDSTYKETVHELWDFLKSEGFQIRKILPCLQSSKVNLSEAMTFHEMTQLAEHGDYYAYRE